MASVDDPLVADFEAELDRPLHPDAAAFTAEILRRHGGAVAFVLFYGSCLRKQAYEDAVLDFYVIVDSYAAAYDSRALAVANRLLAPNVFYLAIEHDGRSIRAKYAVMSTADFSWAASRYCSHAIVWARFSQPAVLAFARDDEARAAAARMTAECAVTMVETMLALMPAAEGDAPAPVDSESLWRFALSQTYGGELRAESDAAVAAVYDAAPERYETVTRRVLETLVARGALLGEDGGAQKVSMSPRRRRAISLRWRSRRLLNKVVYGARLVKTAFTFGDWLPYALWKLERHTGVVIELTDRQRRHPLIFGWPVIVRLLASQRLR